MIRNLSLLSLLSALLLSGCGKPIPEVKDPHRIVVDGKPMTARAFLERYCLGEVQHPTCVAVSRASVMDSTHAKMPKGW
jgi:hypothetical protein